MLCVLGGRQDKMAEEIRFPELRSYSSIAKKKNKKELQKIYKILELPSEKLGKNALINIVCNSLKIPTRFSKLMLETPTQISCLQVMWRCQHT